MLFLLLKKDLFIKHWYKLLTFYLFLSFFIRSYMINFSVFFLFYCATMDSLNIHNHSKASALSNFNRILYKYYPRYSNISKIGVHLNQFLVLLYDCVPRTSYFLSMTSFWRKIMAQNWEWVEIQPLFYTVIPQNVKTFWQKRAMKM